MPAAYGGAPLRLRRRAAWRAVMFDVDGTLLDSRDAILDSYREATREVLGREYPATTGEAKAVLQLRALEVIALLADGDPARERLLSDAYHAAYERLQSSAVPYSGALDALGALRSAGLRVAVVTSKSRSRLELDLARTGLAPLVDASIAGDEVRRGKPDPEPLLAGLRALDARAGAALYVGDSPVDVASARAAGVYSVGVTFGFHGRALRVAGPDLLIDSYDELVAFVTDGAATGA